MLYSNVVFMTFYPLPYLLRGLRVVIVSDKGQCYVLNDRVSNRYYCTTLQRSGLALRCSSCTHAILGKTCIRKLNAEEWDDLCTKNSAYVTVKCD